MIYGFYVFCFLNFYVCHQIVYVSVCVCVIYVISCLIYGSYVICFLNVYVCHQIVCVSVVCACA